MLRQSGIILLSPQAENLFFMLRELLAKERQPGGGISLDTLRICCYRCGYSPSSSM